MERRYDYLDTTSELLTNFSSGIEVTNNLDILKILSESRLDENRTDFPIIFMENDDRELIEKINNQENLAGFRRISLENIVNNNINMSFFHILSTATPQNFYLTIRNICNSPITNREAYKPIENILLLASPGTNEISEIIQLLISHVNEPINQLAVNPEIKICEEAEEARISISESARITDKEIRENSFEHNNERNEITKRHSEIIRRYIRNGLVLAGSSLALYMGQPLWKPLINSLGGILNDTFKLSKSISVNTIDQKDFNNNLSENLVKETVLWVKKWWNDL